MPENLNTAVFEHFSVALQFENKNELKLKTFFFVY